MSFITRLNQLIQEKGITKYRLAKDVGITQQAISNWERGVVPGSAQIVALADYFGVSTDYLLRDAESAEVPEIPGEQILDSISVGGVHLSVTDRNISNDDLMEILDFLRKQQRGNGH